MAQVALGRWSTDEFFAWQAKEAERYELIDGLPVRMMAGASNRHDRVVLNLLVMLGNRLRGSTCTPFTGDGAVETWPGQIRRPDAGVDCGERDPDAFKAAEPVLVVEVLSPSTRDFDTFEKLGEYKRIGTLRHILYVEPNRPEAVLWTRGEGGSWEMVRQEGLDAPITLPALAIDLPMAEIYEGVTFPPPVGRSQPGG